MLNMLNVFLRGGFYQKCFVSAVMLNMLTMLNVFFNLQTPPGPFPPKKHSNTTAAKASFRKNMFLSAVMLNMLNVFLEGFPKKCVFFQL